MIALSDLAHFIQLFSKSLVYKITSKEISMHFHVIVIVYVYEFARAELQL